jgi:hypothetical protein
MLADRRTGAERVSFRRVRIQAKRLPEGRHQGGGDAFPGLQAVRCHRDIRAGTRSRWIHRQRVVSRRNGNRAPER